MTYEQVTEHLKRAHEANVAGNYREAEDIAKQLLTETKAHEETQAKALLILADSALAQGNGQQAKLHAESALTVGKEYQYVTVQSNALNILGNVSAMQSDAQKALEYYNQSLRIIKNGGEKSKEAKVIDNIASVHASLGDYQAALLHFQEARKMYEVLDDKSGLANVMGNLGNVYVALAHYPAALEYLSKALSTHEELGEKFNIARVTSNIGNVYNFISDFEHALEYYKKALVFFEKIGSKIGIAITTNNIGNVYGNLKEYPLALEYYKKALAINEEMGKKSGISNTSGNIGNIYYNLDEYSLALEYYHKALAIAEEIGNKDGIVKHTGNIGSLYSTREFSGFDPALGEELLRRAIVLCEETGAKSNLYNLHKHLYELFKWQERWEESLFQFEQYHRIVKELESEETKKQADKLDFERKQAELEKQLIAERAIAIGERNILNNILPPNIISRLVNGETKIADSYENVSVLFIDIVGFTKITSRLPAHELIDILDMIFTRFDTICKHHGLEKIKTIGDAYMAVCGAPIPNANHANRAADAAIEMLEDFQIEQRFSIPITLEFRIGLHCGSVVAGVIGENKFLYDLWGDAVNTASRMESYGEAGKIHVSEEFVRNLTPALSKREGEDSSSFPFGEGRDGVLRIIPRGEMDIKGKGMMNTYFLEKAHE